MTSDEHANRLAAEWVVETLHPMPVTGGIAIFVSREALVEAITFVLNARDARRLPWQHPQFMLAAGMALGAIAMKLVLLL